MIKKIKIEKVWVGDEKQIESKKNSSVYNVCPVSILVADDCPDYAGKWIRTTVFEYIDPKDANKNKSAVQKAEYLRTILEGKEDFLNITEREYTNKDGESAISLEFKTLTKAQKEVAKEMSK